MEIVLVASEAYPFVKSGGLGDVVGALFKYLPRYGFRVTLFLPMYAQVSREFPLVKQKGLEFSFGDTTVRAEFFMYTQGEGQRLLVVGNEGFFGRERMYGYPDDVERFIFFSRAVFEYLVRWQEEPFILHCHDWQSALVCAYLERYWPPYRPKAIKVVFTIHNLAYQGIGRGDLFRLMNLPSSFFTHEYLEFYGNVNLMKAGLLFSQVITTVSPTYAREICSPEFGEGLDGLLRALSYRKKIVGIVNGIDTEVFHPSIDPLIVERYSSEDLEGKRRNKLFFLKEIFGDNTDTTRPIIAFISRFVEQKGIRLFLESPEVFFSLPAYWFFLGTGEEFYERALQNLSQGYPNLKVIVRFDERLAHLAYAAADFLVLPSLFEPCGISQMIAMSYGTLPIVRGVGGLRDTVIDYPFNPRLSTGFQFGEFSVHELHRTLQRALHVYFKEKDLFRTMVANAMQSDFSWKQAIERYVEVYK
ncbi:glycogen synthase [Candidatus Caldatribacterium sp.]|uniref:glycogen synthase n=1 Tax=Candidatus Caldatribacterium sp. TaxID=2282143 RepID=UPI00299A2FC2|nr:glycogen synthase [Candidatus Caldatribacterium sp.]MDW8080884.1 glycogen synthase [Candidatus Calescibacterium sp.]